MKMSEQVGSETMPE